MSIVIGISAAVSAFATFVIGILTWRNYIMYKEQQQKFNDLLEGIVIATLLSNPNKGVWEDSKTSFLREYKGKTQIFKE